jgi:lipoprotein signal peptidase
VVVVATLADDLLRPSVLSHPRSAALSVVAGTLAAMLLVLAPRAGSAAVSLGAGVAAGGALATLLAGLLWSGGVPNPLVRGGIAFNLADVAIGVGVVVLVAGALLLAWRERAHLGEPV